jgi:manganese/zinc/iron transport system permease protein
MALTAVTTVGAFQLVGIVLVLAFVVVPAATASMLTDDLKRMMGLAVGAGVLAAVLGYGFARLLDVSVSGSIVMMLGAQFALAVLFAPPDAHRALGRGE